MTLQLTQHGETFTISTKDGQDIYQFMDLIEQLCLGAGYQPESVREGFIVKADSYSARSTDENNKSIGI